jgi:hypothetical protein
MSKKGSSMTTTTDFSLRQNFAQFIDQSPEARAILVGPASSAQAAAQITALGWKVSAGHVRHERQRQALTKDALANPQPVGRGVSKDWQPRLDLGTDEGSFATVPRAPTGTMPDDNELLELMGLDADKWAVAADSIRHAGGQGGHDDHAVSPAGGAGAAVTTGACRHSHWSLWLRLIRPWQILHSAATG